MAKTLPISATQSAFIQLRNTIVYALGLAGAAATSVIEFFDGNIDSPQTVSASAAGTGYVIGELLTLVAGENGNANSRTIVRVTQIDYLSPSTSISASPSTSISSSPSTSVSTSVSASPTSSASPSPSASVSPSTSRSSSPSASLSVSTSISSSRSASVSPSTSISSSISASPSPSGTGSGGVTEVEIISAGGGYTAGNVYATTSNLSGAGATIKVLTIADEGTSFGKLQCVANESAPPINFGECGTLTTKGISVRISGTGAKGHITYE